MGDAGRDAFGAAGCAGEQCLHAAPILRRDIAHGRVALAVGAPLDSDSPYKSMASDISKQRPPSGSQGRSPKEPF